MLSSCETPRADPYAGCCGDRGRKTPGYPIGLLLFVGWFEAINHRIMFDI